MQFVDVTLVQMFYNRPKNIEKGNFIRPKNIEKGNFLELHLIITLRDYFLIT